MKNADYSWRQVRVPFEPTRTYSWLELNDEGHSVSFNVISVLPASAFFLELVVLFPFFIDCASAADFSGTAGLSFPFFAGAFFAVGVVGALADDGMAI